MRGLGCRPTDGSAAVWLPARQGLYCFLRAPADPAPGLLGPRALARWARPEARAEAPCHVIPGQEGDTPGTLLIRVADDPGGDGGRRQPRPRARGPGYGSDARGCEGDRL